MELAGLKQLEEKLVIVDAPAMTPTDHHRDFETFSEMYPEGVQLSEANVRLLTRKSEHREAVTFDELTLEDQPVDFHPNDVSLTTHITRNIYLKGCGLMSSAMDTVTEGELALAMAKNGGIGIIHRNLSIEEQAEQIKWVRHKIHFGGMINKPITFHPSLRFSEFESKVSSNGWHFTSFPVVDEHKVMLGLITRDQMEFVGDENPTLREVMLPIEQIVTAPSGTVTTQAYEIMQKRKVKKLPVLGTGGELEGMYVWNDVKSDANKSARFSLDNDGHFLVGGAIGVGAEEVRRAEALVRVGCKLLVIDSSHGSCAPVKNMIASVRARWGNSVEIIAGNIASYKSAMYLLEADAKPDGLKVGIGPGSICTTRQVTGHGIPQVTAIFETWRAVRDYGQRTGYHVPIVADGGIKTSGDIVKAFAAGASGIMMGSVMAGCLESPGSLVMKNGRKYKSIRGMGSRSAMEERAGSRMRYFSGSKGIVENARMTNSQAQKVVPEGVEGLVELRGTVEHVLTQLMGGVQAGLAHSGALKISSFQAKAEFWLQSTVGLREGLPHDIMDIRES